MAKPPKQKVVSKKHQAHVKRDQEQRKKLIIAAVALFIVILGVIGYGVLDNTVLTNYKAVAKVDNTSIKVEDYAARVRFQRYQLIQQAYTYAQYAQIFGSDASTLNYITTLIGQVETQLSDSETMGSQIIDQMINEEIIKKYASENNITVSDQEVEDTFQGFFGYYPNGTPTAAPTSTPYTTSTLSAQQLAIVTITPTPTKLPSATPLPTEEVTPTQEEIASTPADTATPLPSPTPITEEGYKTNFSSFLDKMAEINVSESSIRDIYKTQLIYTKVYNAITSDVKPEEEQVWARHILVGTEAEAAVIRNLIVNDGQDWATLAADKSTDTSNKDVGGDLGWFGKGEMESAFEDAAFSLEIGEISQPVQTTYGWHLIQVIGKEVRTVSSDRLSQLQSTAFSNWLTEQKTLVTIEKFDNVWKPNTPVDPEFPAELSTAQ